jgi:hypothetical protein
MSVFHSEIFGERALCQINQFNPSPVYATTQNGERFHSSDFDVRVKKYGGLTYIADVCP